MQSSLGHAAQLAGRGCDPNYFSVSYQNDNLHEAAGAFAKSEGYQKPFIMAPNYPAGKDSLNGFKRFYGGELAGEVYTQLGQTDYAAEIAQIKARFHEMTEAYEILGDMATRRQYDRDRGSKVVR